MTGSGEIQPIEEGSEHSKKSSFFHEPFIRPLLHSESSRPSPRILAPQSLDRGSSMLSILAPTSQDPSRSLLTLQPRPFKAREGESRYALAKSARSFVRSFSLNSD